MRSQGVIIAWILSLSFSALAQANCQDQVLEVRNSDVVDIEISKLRYRWHDGVSFPGSWKILTNSKLVIEANEVGTIQDVQYRGRGCGQTLEIKYQVRRRTNQDTLEQATYEKDGWHKMFGRRLPKDAGLDYPQPQ